MTKVGRNIQILRTRKKMTQNDLAEKLFVSRQTVSNYENGKSNPDIEMLVKIAEILECDVNTLIYGIPTPPDRKRDYWKLGIAAGLFVVLGALILWLRPIAEELSRKYFLSLPLWVIRTVVYPCFYLVTGWGGMQLLSVIMGLNRIKIKHKRKIYIGIVMALVAVFLILLPYEIASVTAVIELLPRLTNRVEGNWSFDFSIFPQWDTFVIFHLGYFFIYKYNPIFIVPGILLWMFGGQTSIASEQK